MAKSFESQLIAHVAAARERSQAGAAELHRLTESRQYSDEFKSTLKAEAAGKLRADVDRYQTDALERWGSHRGRAEAQIDALTPSHEAKAVAAAALKPVLDVAASRPDVLFSAYRRTFEDPASRAVLEGLAETIGSDILQGGVKVQFQEQWQRVQNEMAPQQPAAEKAARAELARSDRAMEYLRSARDVVKAELKQAIDGGTTPDVGARIHATHAKFAMQQFEQSAAADE